MATRQNSSNGKPKSPRVQVVLPEHLCDRLASLAEIESRTVSNMAKVLIQEGIQRYEQNSPNSAPISTSTSLLATTEGFRSALVAQESKPMRGIPRRIRIRKP